MPRYIDADALKERMMIVWDEADKRGRKDISRFFADIATPLLIGTPTADVVEVVRCKDCDWYREDGGICVNSHCTKSYYGCRVRKDHYCSFGERRDDE